MSELSVDFLEQILRVRVVSDDPIPDDKGESRAAGFARLRIDEVYGEDAELWVFSEVKRVDARKVDAIFYYMD